jgi:septal ring factor EnvC (AmiA/AmiB activator)
MLGWVALCAGAALLAQLAGAGDIARLSEADRKQVNDWMAERAALMVESHTLDSEVRQTWMDPSYATPEIAQLRARYAELQQELLRTQREIEAKVREIPAVAAKVRQLEESKRRERELTKKITEKVGE